MAGGPQPTEEPLAVLLLPSKLEEFELADYARDLLTIPRVVALEPRVALRKLFGEIVAARQARRLKLPGMARVLVLYGPQQYPLARAMLGRYNDAELWYVSNVAEPERAPEDELVAQERLARERARYVLAIGGPEGPRVENEPLRRRLLELEVITHRPFVPGARFSRE
jgi:hypothetical protein